MEDDATKADGVQAELAKAGWSGHVAGIQMDKGMAQVTLKFGPADTHRLIAMYHLATQSWRIEELYLLSSAFQRCPLPPDMNVLDATYDQVMTAALALPDVPLLRAQICALANMERHVPIRELVERAVNLHDWNRHRLFAALAWMLAEDWPIGDTPVARETSDDELIRAIKHALRLHVTSLPFMSPRYVKLPAAK